MAQSSQDALQSSLQDLEDEIAFQNILLKSLDDVDEPEESAEEIKREIATLREKWNTLKRAGRAAASTSAHIPSVASSQTSSANKSPSKRAQNSSTEAGSIDSDMNRESWPGRPGLDSTASTPNSHSADFPDLASPSFMSLPSRKRTHSKHLSGNLEPIPYENKSRKTTPNHTSPATPGSTSGEDDFPDLDTLTQRQRIAEDRLEREKLDAEFARSLQNDGFVQTGQSSSTSGPNAFNRMSGMRPQAPPYLSTNNTPSNSTLAYGEMAQPASRRKLPWMNTTPSQASSSNEVKSEPRMNAYSIKSEGGTNQYPSQGSKFSSRASLPYVKPEQRYTMNNVKSEYTMDSLPVPKKEEKFSMPGSYRDDSSTADDSDIEIIPASAFHGNGRQSLSGTANNSGFSPLKNEGDAARQRLQQAAPNSTLQNALFGNQQRPAWMTAGLQPSPSPYGMGMAGQYAYPSQALPSSSAVNGGMYPGYPGTTNQGVLGMVGSEYDDPLDLEALEQFNKLFDENGMPIAAPNFTTQMTEQYDYIVNDPRKTNAEIKALLENIRPDMDLPAEDREGTPAGLKYPLYEHQKLALTWLKSMETGTNRGGILADDMGLGKTISTLALMLTRQSSDPLRKTTLIVGPVALLRQWEREIKQKTLPAHRLSTCLVHGQTRKKLSWDDLRMYDIVLTTYGTLGAEWKRHEKHLVKEKAAGNVIDENACKKLFPIMGPKSLFYRVVLDEAQCIKGKNTVAARAACHVKSKYRFCLTGTPMMNNVGELYSLIHFLRIKPYNDYKRFQEDFGKLTKGSQTNRSRDNAMQKLQTVLKAILLRRTKQSEIDGKPIISLPPKTTEIQHVVFSDEEKEFYTALESKTQIQFNKYLRAGTVGKNYSNVLVLLLRLRQACCHPHLIQDFEEAPPIASELSEEGLLDLAKSLSPDVVRRLLEADGFECPICYDGVQNPSIIIPCGHNTCTECLANISASAQQQNIANGEEAGAAAKCPTCRGDLRANKVIDYKTFQKVHDPQAVNDEEMVDESDGSDEDSDEDSSESESEDEDEGGNSDGDLRGFVVPDDVEDTEDEAEDEAEDGDAEEAEVEPKAKKVAKKGKKASKGSKKDKKGKGKAKEKKPHLSLAMLKKESSKNAKGKRRYMRYLRKNWQPSAKVDKCVELLEQFQQEGEKTIVFSQFVSLLDLLQVPIDEKGWDMERYDGGMKGDDRNDAIVRFTDKPNCKIMLISLKAGNAGLNLVAASRVIILDPFWNPYIEMQAVDRAYRIGQQKSVQVHRILIETTVEDRIIELQEQKRKLVDAALDEGANKSLGRLDVRQLAYLFGVQHD